MQAETLALLKQTMADFSIQYRNLSFPYSTILAHKFRISLVIKREGIRSKFKSGRKKKCWNNFSFPPFLHWWIRNGQTKKTNASRFIWSDPEIYGCHLCGWNIGILKTYFVWNFKYVWGKFDANVKKLKECVRKIFLNVLGFINISTIFIFDLTLCPKSRRVRSWW